jgi:hypothetical protein
MGGSMNPWHRTTGKCPCGKDGHMPEEAGEYWYKNQYTYFWAHYEPASNRPWFCYSPEGKGALPFPVFWRIPDGHPPIPEE